MPAQSNPLRELVDGHAHLNEIEDIEGALERAAAAGVARILAVGMDISSNRKVLEIAASYPELVLPSVGFHPWSIPTEQIEATLDFLKTHLEFCTALGEVGLDYKAKVKKAVQWEVFARVLDLAAEFEKPVIVHARFSHQRCHRMVSEAKIKKAVFHWYSGPLDLLEKIIADGYFVSCTPALAYSTAHQAAIRQAPLERILIETDCPVEYRGKVSEPAHLIDTLTHLSRLKELPIEQVARITTANARAFFGIC
jgi:TatD DNase family protein